MTKKNNKKVEVKDEDLEIVNGGINVVKPGEACQYGRTVFDTNACKGCIFYSNIASGYASCDAGVEVEYANTNRWGL